MRSTVVTLAMTFTPALLFAQASTTTTTSARAGATVDSPRAHAVVGVQASAGTDGEFQAPSDFSARDRANLEATFRRARAEHVPEQPLRERVAEGQTKGASAEQIVVATAMLETRLAASQNAMIRAGHAHPSDAEIERGAAAEEAGYTSAQIEAVARRTPPDRSLLVPLDVLAKLAARGVPTGQAVTQVESRLDARASDDALTSLLGSGDADASAASKAGTGAAAGVGAAGNAAAGVNAAHGAGAVTGAVTGSVGGAVTGVLGHRP